MRGCDTLRLSDVARADPLADIASCWLLGTVSVSVYLDGEGYRRPAAKLRRLGEALMGCVVREVGHPAVFSAMAKVMSAREAASGPLFAECPAVWLHDTADAITYLRECGETKTARQLQALHKLARNVLEREWGQGGVERALGSVKLLRDPVAAGSAVQ